MFPQQSPIFSVPLFDTRNTDAPAFVLDVVPARWDCVTSFDDAVLTLVGELWSPRRGEGEWFDRENRAMTIASQGMQHPEFTMEPGGAMIHAGTPLAHALPVLADRGGITLPNGDVLATNVFGNGHIYHHPRFSHGTQNLDLFRRRADGDFAHAARSAALGVCLATVATARPYDEHGMRAAISVVADVLARTLACVPASGQQAVEKLGTEMRDFQGFLARSWIVRPDTAWRATQWITGQGWEDCLAAADPYVLDAARAATAFLVDAHNAPVHLLSHNTSPMTAHQKLSVKGERRALEQVVLHALAPVAHALKPKAAAGVRALTA